MASRIKPSGWSHGEKLTSAQQNALDIRATANATEIEELADYVLGYGREKDVAFPFSFATQNLNSRWELVGGIWRQTNITDGGVVVFPFALPHNGQLIRARLFLEGASHTNLPASMPAFQLAYREIGDSVIGQIVDTATDTADLATYQTVHEIDLDCSEELSDETTWMIIVSGESGANAQTGLDLLGVQFRIDVLPS
jgi:hypothetical protein